MIVVQWTPVQQHTYVGRMCSLSSFCKRADGILKLNLFLIFQKPSGRPERKRRISLSQICADLEEKNQELTSQNKELVGWGGGLQKEAHEN